MSTNVMTHRGYIARVEFDDADGIFHGQLLGMRAVVSFHGDTVPKLRKAMKEAVAAYLESCERRGEAPEKPASGTLSLRLAPELHGAAAVAAEASGQSLNQWIGELIETALHEPKKVSRRRVATGSSVAL